MAYGSSTFLSHTEHISDIQLWVLGTRRWYTEIYDLKFVAFAVAWKVSFVQDADNLSPMVYVPVTMV